MNIVVVGGSGLLGSVLVPKLQLSDNNVTTVGRSQVNDYRCDISDVTSTYLILDRLKPDILINLVALTDVDLCETDPRQAFLINVRVTENMVSWIETGRKECHFIQISTDQVYDGNGPHREADVMLTNYYSFSKYASELAVSRVSSTVLRTNFFGISSINDRPSFTDWIYSTTHSNAKNIFFNDVFFSPLSMHTLSEMIALVAEVKPLGTYNLGSHKGLSKAEFALMFLDKLNLKSRNMEIKSIEDVTFMKTYRPKDMRMSVIMFEEQVGVKLPALEDEITRVIVDYY